MRNLFKAGVTLTLTPAVATASGVGVLIGSLFGVAVNDVDANTDGEFLTEGVVELPKTSALAVTVGQRLFWDATNRVVNATASGQMCIGVAASAAANPSATVLVKLGPVPPSGA